MFTYLSSNIITDIYGYLKHDTLDDPCDGGRVVFLKEDFNAEMRKSIIYKIYLVKLSLGI